MKKGLLTEVCILFFSSMVKDELCRMESPDSCCVVCELASVIRTSGRIEIKDNSPVIRIVTENSAFARRLFSRVKKLYNINPQVNIKKSRKLKKHVLYIISMPVDNNGGLLDKAGVRVYSGGEGINYNYISASKLTKSKDCCKRAFLRGAFLAGGSISNPEKTYHLEITSCSGISIRELKRLINSYGLSSKVIRRKGNYVAYIKEAENIADFLNIIHAHKALLRFENIRIMKEMRNSVNRIVNCETANVEKSVNASLRHIENIKYIKENSNFENLPENLKEIARLRLEYADANLKELGQMLYPPLGKSGVNHRLRKLEKIAKKLKDLHKNTKYDNMQN